MSLLALGWFSRPYFSYRFWNKYKAKSMKTVDHSQSQDNIRFPELTSQEELPEETNSPANFPKSSIDAFSFLLYTKYEFHRSVLKELLLWPFSGMHADRGHRRTVWTPCASDCAWSSSKTGWTLYHTADKRTASRLQKEPQRNLKALLFFNEKPTNWWRKAKRHTAQLENLSVSLVVNP